MNKCYEINGFPLRFITSHPFTESECMKPFAARQKAGATECIFIEGDPDLRNCGEVIFHKKPITIVKIGDDIVRLFTPPVLGHPVAATFYRNGKIKCIYNKQYADFVLQSINMLNIIGFENIAAANGSYILHCSFVNVGGRAILFSGECGAGKSTRAAMWNEKYGCEIINGDKALISQKNGVFYASGLPVAGSSRVFINKSIPIESIIFLEKNAENINERLTGRKALMRIYKNIIVSADERFRSDAALFAGRIATDIPCIVSRCNLEKQSTELQYRMIFG